MKYIRFKVHIYLFNVVYTIVCVHRVTAVVVPIVYYIHHRYLKKRY